MITEVHQQGRFYRTNTGRAAHFENLKPQNPSTEDCCIPEDIENGDYLMMDLLARSRRKVPGRRTMGMRF